jgi:hypothetical protein
MGRNGGERGVERRTWGADSGARPGESPRRPESAGRRGKCFRYCSVPVVNVMPASAKLAATPLPP